MRIVQVKLANITNMSETLTTWLDKRPGLSRYATVTLKDYRPDEIWRVLEVYDGEHDSQDFDFHRKWDNNNYDQHKGLEL